MDALGVVGAGSQGPRWVALRSGQRTSRPSRILRSPLRQDIGNAGQGQGLSLLETSEARGWAGTTGLAQSSNIRTVFRQLLCVSDTAGRRASASQARFLSLLGTRLGYLLWLHSQVGVAV